MGKRYSKEEDDFIFAKVQENPHNLAKCFIQISQALNRPVEGIRCRWYNVLSNPNSPLYKGTASILLGKNSMQINRKLNTDATKQHPVKYRVSIWKRILNLLRL